jgi:serine/threonine protein kinase
MPVDPARLKDVFVHALARPAPADRAAYLDAECAGDVTLRARVEALLRASDDPDSLLDSAAPAPPPDDPATRPFDPAGDTVDRPDAPTASVGDPVGPYKLLERIGEGGMGEVWVAVQTEPIRRRVAVKLIKPGMDSRSVLGRFEAERQALAVMDHPNIARVLDAGTAADGRPYFVMELVKGTPVTEFADARKLTTKQRLELFVPVCQAIQHAHMKGIIHRDIKPGNVLVELHDDRAVVKVIDFGVAKAVGQQLTERTVYTGFGALVGTPAYMAPEQATFNALDVDTRADVYALGVLLYELLAGSPPIEKERLKKAALDEVLRMVREEEPPRPSQRLSTADTRASIAAVRGSEPAKLSALMKGELDWIVMKALEKDRARRYETANGFAADITRYLAGEPVQAVPPSLGYRARKFVRKHRGPVIVVAVVATAVLLGTAGTTGGMVWALDAEGKAKRDRDAAVKAEGEAAANAETARAEAEKVRVGQDRTRRLLYASELARGSSALADGRDEQIFQTLAETTPKAGESDLRGWEWHYLNRLYHPPVTEVRLGSPVAKDATATPALVVGPRSVATRGDAAGIWFEVYDTASGKPVGRVPKDETLRVALPPPPPARPGIVGTPWEGAGGPGRTPLPAAGLDPDGRYLQVVLTEWKGTTPLSRLRLWRVDTGEELEGLPADVSYGPFAVGPDAAWVAWVELPASAGRNKLPQPPTPTFHRWARATKAVESRPLASLDPASRMQITADGRSVLAVVEVPKPPDADEHTRGEMNLQCWDVTADPPKLRFKPNRIAWRTPVMTQPDNVVINPAGTVAAVWRANEVAVVSLADGEPLWRHTVGHPPLPKSGWDQSAWQVVGVSGDGRRVVFREAGRVMVVEHPPRFGPCREWVIRHGSRPVVTSPSGRLWMGPRFQNGQLNPAVVLVSGSDMALSPDGRTAYVGGGSDVFQVGLLDLSSDPRMPGPEARPRRTLARVGEGFGGFEVHDADGRNLGPVTQTGVWCELLADRWVLCGNPSGNRISDEGGPAGTFLGAWELHDTADPKRFRQVAGGTGRATRSEDGRWVVVRDAIGVRTTGPAVRFAPHWATTTVYRVEDGRKACEAAAPPGSSFVAARVAPGGGHWAALTQPTPSGGSPDLGPLRFPAPLPPAAAHTLRLYDLETGREAWSRELGSTQRPANPFHFCRDGKRLLVMLTEGQELRVSIVRTADGTVENEFRVPMGVWLAKPAETPDGKLVFANAGEVQFWDAATGEQIRRFPGHEKIGPIALTPDSRRMFVLDRGDNRTEAATVHVWDTDTGRELLVVPAEGFDLQAPEPKFEFADGKLLYTATDGVRVLDGQPLPEPKK